ncbi:xanthine dehydrogenase family protein molybdopterin-binding subunit [Microvirga sp. BT689]|uniref:xanthine dehydrogenase family protein molybdopterin-binding subunit n=1 Tax=Microvirga arvi TaxID=2778731 RepID=UPI0019520474|nr:xanthine dehydrogenase family protein molybdopterin-binding subunit [Microvirga arvi]MBM6581163.1 xanthine dehydrogenase family protein molybdopterin-binding subunit [Microvirga arvi]
MVKSIGAPHDRIDGIPKVTGGATYAADVKLEGQLYAIALQSTIAAGKIVALESASAEATPGVVAVYSHLNARQALTWIHADELLALSAEALGLSAFPSGSSRPRGYLPLTSPEIYFAGQWIAVVVAESIEAARHGVGRIKVRYEVDAASVVMNDEKDDWIEPTFFFGADMQVQRGDAPKTRHGEVFIQETYATPMQLHQPMEPSATTAYWDGDDVTLFDSTQGVVATREYVAQSLKVPKEKVRVISAYVGGGFGSKNQVWPHQALAAHMARALGRPVRLQLTRSDMALASGHRSFTEQDVRLSADRDGKIRLLQHISRVPTSIQGGFFEPCGLNSLLLYGAEELDVRHRVSRKNIPTPTPFRAPGETPGSFALESALDELAHTLKMDPLELRRRNFPSRDSYHDRDWSSNHLLECYRLGAAAFSWPGRYVPPRSIREGSEMVGYGMATTAYPAPALPATVKLRLQVQGRAIIETSATDIGTGMYTILAQTVADELGLPVSQLEVRLGDSSFPNAPTAGRSKSTASVLPAARQACLSLREKLALLGASYSPTPQSNESIFSLLEREAIPEVVVEGTSTGMPREHDLSFYSFGAHFVEVRVDEEIGRIRVSRVVSALDCGRIINPKTATSQIKGGIVFGIGMALMEQGEFDPIHSRLINDNLADYHIPVNADIGEIDVIFIDKPDTRFNEFGARGLGEIGVPGTAAAITNALYCATGKRIRSLPATAAALL